MYSHEIINLLDKIKNINKVVLTTHVRPDADGWGSQLGMYFLLQSLNKEVCIYNQDEFNLANLDEVSNEMPIKCYSKKNQPNKEDIKDSIFISIDNSDIERLGEVKDYIKEDLSNIILIDHHDDIISDNNTYFIFPEASATSEIVFLLINLSKLTMPKIIAQSLYRGLVVDNGFFRYQKTNPVSHRVAANLLEIGVKPAEISESLYSHFPFARLKARQILYNSLQCTNDMRVVWMKATLEELTKNGVSLDEVDGLVDEPLEVSKVLVSVIFTQRQENITRVSFRTRQGYDLLKLVNLYGGGGHKTACGMFVYQNLEDCINTVIPKIEELINT